MKYNHIQLFIFLPTPPHLPNMCLHNSFLFIFFLIVYLAPASTTHVDMAMRKTASGHTLKEE